MRIKKFFIYLIPCLFLIFACSCSKNKVYQDRITLEDNTWDRLEGNKTLIFSDVEIKDTAALYDIYVTLRHTPFVNERAIRFLMKIIYPDGITRESIYTISLKNEESNSWKGDAMGDMIDVEERCRAFVSLPVEGKYTISLTNLGTYNKTIGLMDIGVMIKKSNLKEYKQSK
ncbi:MAG: hypothetical protein IJ748_03110 [Bacteroidales bacterium]|nr:hypothetical protein [Bacteroidales bacterium]